MGLFDTETEEDKLIRGVRKILNEIYDLDSRIGKFRKLEKKCMKNPGLGDPKDIAKQIVVAEQRKIYLDRQLEAFDQGIVRAELAVAQRQNKKAA